MPGRYAVYYVPDLQSDLYRLGAAFLGRCVYQGKSGPRPELKKVPEEIIVRHTQQASRYGLHGTIVAPFETAADETRLAEAVAGIARDTVSFKLDRPYLTAVDNTFAAVVTERMPEELRLLEHRCVRELSCFRLPLNETGIARRGTLSPKHMANLRQWGYHLVFDEFVFHITIADSLPDEAEIFLDALQLYFEPALREPLIFDRLGLFYQPSRTEPFICRKIFFLQEFDNGH